MTVSRWWWWHTDAVPDKHRSVKACPYGPGMLGPDSVASITVLVYYELHN